MRTVLSMLHDANSHTLGTCSRSVMMSECPVRQLVSNPCCTSHEWTKPTALPLYSMEYGAE